MTQGLCFSVSRCSRADGGFTRTRAVLRTRCRGWGLKSESDDATCLNTNGNRKWSICLYLTTENANSKQTGLKGPERMTHVLVFPFVFIWMWERMGEALGPWGLCSKWQQLLLLLLLPPLKAVYQESWAPPDKNKGWDLSRRSSVSDACSAQALRPPRTCSVIWFRQQTVMWVNSGQQLCKMFFSLHIVFLSGAIVESSAARADQLGKAVHTSLAAHYYYYYGAFL